MGFLAEGGCVCGSIRYAVRSEPDRVINCACNFCQRSTGGHYLVATMFPVDQLEVISGKPKTYDHRSEGSGKQIHVHFCADCGTKVFMTFERYEGFCEVFSGTFDDPNWFATPPEKTRYIYLGNMSDGVTLPEGYDVFFANGLKLDGSNNTPQRFDKPTTVTRDVREAARAFALQNGEL